MRMIIIDSEGQIVFANHQVETLFGYPASSLVGKQVELLLPERFRSRHVGHRVGYGANTRVRPMGSGLDLFARRSDGSEFPVEISLSPAHGWRQDTRRRGDPRHHRSARDPERAAPGARRSRSRKPGQEPLPRHGESRPAPAPQALSLLNGTMRRLVTDGPLADVLEQEEQAIAAMSRLLNALLDISKLESGAIQPEMTDFKVAQLFEEMRREFAVLAANKGLRFEVDSCADRVSLRPRAGRPGDPQPRGQRDQVHECGQRAASLQARTRYE